MRFYQLPLRPPHFFGFFKVDFFVALRGSDLTSLAAFASFGLRLTTLILAALWLDAFASLLKNSQSVSPHSLPTSACMQRSPAFGQYAQSSLSVTNALLIAFASLFADALNKGLEVSQNLLHINRLVIDG